MYLWRLYLCRSTVIDPAQPRPESVMYMAQIIHELNKKFDGSFIRTVSTLGGCTVIAFAFMYFFMDIMKEDREYYRTKYSGTVENLDDTLKILGANSLKHDIRQEMLMEGVTKELENVGDRLGDVAKELDDIADAHVESNRLLTRPTE